MAFDNEAVRAAEESLLGCILLDAKVVLPKVVDAVSADDFYYGDLGNTYRAIIELSSQGTPVDFVTVLSKVKSKYDADEANVKKILLHCCQLTPSVGGAESYAKLVSGGRKARTLRDIGTRLLEEAATPETATDVANDVMAELYSLAVPKSQKRLKPIGEIATAYFNQLDKKYDSQDNRVDTGFAKVDEILKGMCGGNVIILAARPKVGKTALAATVAENVAKTGKKVAVYSLEMEDKEVYERMLSRNTGIAMNTLIDRKFNRPDAPEAESTKQIGKIAEVTDQLYELPLLISDNPVRTANDIRLECRMIKDLGLIVVDYLQLMKPTGKCDNRNQEIGSITRELKIVSAELGVPILLLSQLNRDKGDNERPTVRDLRDSGEIEQNCNKALLMWATEVHKDELGKVIGKTVGLDIALNRRGNTGVVLMKFSGNYMTFTESDEKYEEPVQKRGLWETRV